LVDLYDGRRKHDWDQTATLARLIHNQWVTKKADLATDADFHPYRRPTAKQEKPIKKAENTGDLLIATFCN
jgi:hypothetical protein